jgi:hypothetical protein
MPEFTVPQKNDASGYTFYVALVSTANRPDFQANPTLATGDFQVSIDGAAYGNLGTLPTVAPAASVNVKIVLSQAEINGDNIIVKCIDAAGGEWDDLLIELRPASRKLEDLAYPTTTGRSIDVTATGEVGVDLGNVTGTLTNANVAAVDANERVDVGDWVGVAPNPLVGGNVQTRISSSATGSITASTLLAGTINAAALATDAVNEIRDAILSDATKFAGANIDAAVSTRATPAQVATELTNIGLDHLVAAAVVGADITNNSIIARLASSAATADWDTFVNTTDSLQGLRDVVALASVCSEARLAELDAANLPTTTDDILTATGTTIPGTITTLQADTDDIQARLPAALVAGKMDSDATAISGSTAAADNLEASAEVLVTGAAVAGTLSTTQMTTNLAEATDDHYNGRLLTWTSGLLIGQQTDITDYTGATKLLTFTAVTEAPTATDTFVIQ